MIVRNPVTGHISLVLLDGKPKTDDPPQRAGRSDLNVPMTIGITKAYVAFASLLVEKRIII
ncbi:hypothetical protein J2X69_003447 [Algoriphagus sp. 4150]|uniref:hypothetical protein n=1 Tax=Algoriphagus sp. 4150 TaxID=2817756 RepID=UPI00286015FE|nr:hypothetical protein [Algoriphagus sp. 4150]MDR7131088.1 hypothetical protein [Algoriphagus sp. 4150]